MLLSLRRCLARIGPKMNGVTIMKQNRKTKSKTAKIDGAEALPNSGEAPNPHYRLEQMEAAETRFERSCRRHYEQLCGLIDGGLYEQLLAEAVKGFEQAQKRRRGKRWPMFGKPAEDLPQAVCIMLMFGDVHHEGDPFVTDEIQCAYGAAVAELRQEVDYHHGSSQAREETPDVFTRCMVQVKKTFPLPAEEKAEQRNNRPARPARPAVKNKVACKRKPGAKEIEMRARSRAIRDLLKKDHHMSAEDVGKKVGCSAATVTRDDAWQKNQLQLGNKPKEGRKRDPEQQGPDTEIFGAGCQAEHMDIKEMIDDYNSGQTTERPTTRAVMTKLEIKAPGEAERLIRETLHHFPNLEYRS